MNKLWVFGDNSSCVFGRTKERRFEFYKRYRGGSFPLSWSEILSKSLNLTLKNYAIAGQSNYDIFEWFCKMVNNIEENDIVLIGWSDTQRFRLYDDYTKDYITIRPNAITKSNTPTILNGITLDTINDILENRKSQKYIEEINNWELLINKYAELKRCKIFYWSFNEDLCKPHYIGGEHSNLRDYLISIGAEDITTETNNFLNDDHFGEKGHFIQSKFFHKFLS